MWPICPHLWASQLALLSHWQILRKQFTRFQVTPNAFSIDEGYLETLWTVCQHLWGTTRLWCSCAIDKFWENSSQCFKSPRMHSTCGVTWNMNHLPTFMSPTTWLLYSCPIEKCWINSSQCFKSPLMLDACGVTWNFVNHLPTFKRATTQLWYSHLLINLCTPPAWRNN